MTVPAVLVCNITSLAEPAPVPVPPICDGVPLVFNAIESPLILMVPVDNICETVPIVNPPVPPLTVTVPAPAFTTVLFEKVTPVPVKLTLPVVVKFFGIVKRPPKLERVILPVPVEIAELGNVKTPDEISVNGLLVASVSEANPKFPVLLRYVPPEPDVIVKLLVDVVSNDCDEVPIVPLDAVGTESVIAPPVIALPVPSCVMLPGVNGAVVVEPIVNEIAPVPAVIDAPDANVIFPAVVSVSPDGLLALVVALSAEVAVLLLAVMVIALLPVAVLIFASIKILRPAVAVSVLLFVKAIEL